MSGGKKSVIVYHLQSTISASCG